MPKANIIITQEDDGLWAVQRGKKTLVESCVDSMFRWKYARDIHIDDQVRFSTGELIDILSEVPEL